MKNSQHRNRTGRKPALSSIGLAVVATLITSGVHAASTSYDFDGLANAYGHQSQNLPLSNSGAVGATIFNGAGSITGNGSQSGSATFLSGNIMDASAFGNQAMPVNTSINLSLISDTGPGYTGAATLLHSTNTGVVSSLVDSNSLSIDLTGFVNGSAANNNNAIGARTVVNEGVSSIAGIVPNGYSSETPGSTNISTFGGSGALSSAAGSIVVTTAQRASDATAKATATNNLVSLALTSDTLAAVEAGAALTGNRVSASVKGNSSASTIDIQNGGAPSFTGSAVVSNTQLGQNASAVADNSNATVSATVRDTNELNAGQLGGSLAVSGNSISSAATGNEALGSGLASVGNRIVLGDGLAFAGTGGTTPGATLKGYAAGTAVAADLLIANTQRNQGVVEDLTPTVVSSSTSNGVVRATVDSLVNGNVNLLANTITSSATGNAASSALASGTGAASFNGSAALANQQDNSNVAISASNTGSTIVATVGAVNDTRTSAGDVQDSSVAVAGNRSSASARGNEVGQSLALDATTLTLGSTVDLSSLVDITDATLLKASGAATVSSRQVNTGAPVSALNAASSIGQRAGTVSGPTLSVDGNTQDAVALANNASNQLTLNGTTVGGSAGILSLQRVDPADGDTVPNSAVSASLSGARAFLEAGSSAAGVTGSTLALTNNVQEAIGYGNLGNNALVVTGTTLAAPSTTGAASTVTFNPAISKVLGGNVVAAYGVLNDQSVGSDVSARATRATGASADIVVTGALGNSAVLNNANTLAAEAYGNFGQSRLALTATNLGDGGSSSVGNLTSLQAVDAAITAQASTGAVALTTINGAVGSDAVYVEQELTSAPTVSSVSASGNRIDAQASGSRVANTLNVNATNIATVAAAATGAYESGGSLTTNAAFSLQNAQSGQGSVTATLRDADNALLASDVRVAITGDVTRSSVVADGNTARASATSNNASNALAIDALGGLASSSALQNNQVTSAGVNSLIGQAGTAGTSATGPATYSAGATSNPVSSGTNFNTQSGLLTVPSGEQVTFSTAGITNATEKAALENYLVSLGFVLTGNSVTTPTGGGTFNLVNLTNRGSTTGGNGTTYNFSGFTVPGTSAVAAVPNLGGVNLAVGGAVSRATLSVSDNTTYGLARGNAATNLTSVKGNAITSGSSTVAKAGEVADIGFGSGLETVADHALSNVQAVTGTAPINSNVYGSFFIDAQPGADISRSSLSVSGNTQMAEARANIAGNSLTLESTALSAFSALQSVQTSNAAVNASSDLNLFAPVAVSDSSVMLSNNSNIALAVINDATNRLTATGSQVGTGQTGTGTVGSSMGDSLTAENVLANQQTANTSVSSTASTRLNNQGAFADSTGGAIRSTLSVLGNTTAAEATANQASNTASVTGTASQAASVALRNIQDSGANVTATATSEARVALAPLSQDALNASSVLLDGNNTTAMASGNTTRNVLDSLAGSVNGTPSGGSVLADVSGSGISANAGILNSQNNTGAVLASSTSTSRIALAPLQQQDALNALNASSVLLDGNSTMAMASGNTATNVLNSLAGSNYGATLGGSVRQSSTGTVVSANAGILNSQNNTGEVKASSTSASYQVALNSTGAASIGSSLGVIGNQVAAQAYGNSAVNQLSLNALNTGTPTSAVGSYQSNSGAVTAAVNSVAFGAGITGAMTGSTVRATGNQITATAVGNSAVSSILAR